MQNWHSVPAALRRPRISYGKRPIYLSSVLATMAVQIWPRYTKTNGKWIPTKFLAVISCSGFGYGSNSVWFKVLNGTTSLILGGTPYNSAASMIGLSYGARFGDWAVLKAAPRNGGIIEPEQRLWLLSASLILIPDSLIL